MLTTESANRKDIRTGKADMQHRHFATIAAIIRDLDPGYGYRENVARDFADGLSGTNARFDRKRFLTACGIAA